MWFSSLFPQPGFSDEVVAGACTSSTSSELSAPGAPDNSKLLDYFEYPKDAEGACVEEAAPICKICDQTLESGGETTADMMKHLQENHEMVYAEVQVTWFKFLQVLLVGDAVEP